MTVVLNPTIWRLAHRPARDAKSISVHYDPHRIVSWRGYKYLERPSFYPDRVTNVKPSIFLEVTWK